MSERGPGPFTADLVDQPWQWEQDPGTLVGYGRQTPRREGFQHQARGTDDQLRFTVYDITAPPPTPAGTTAVLIDHHVRTGEFVIQLGPDHCGKAPTPPGLRLPPHQPARRPPRRALPGQSRHHCLRTRSANPPTKP
ncbi:hypothetical protein [Amycolatopsis rubida]|uniref:Uncharacterized protein n=1 Tax=Amycolatopsis rubida TaxID=112413 RepID=A0A1I5VID1_9PSEU|nr:hypothetical protein [Amycolatopsis rubida]SFQ07318.1 hypothetical protein SAMN05421854_108369 [Amycolatopsis rubida]